MLYKNIAPIDFCILSLSWARKKNFLKIVSRILVPFSFMHFFSFFFLKADFYFFWIKSFLLLKHPLIRDKPNSLCYSASIISKISFSFTLHNGAEIPKSVRHMLSLFNNWEHFYVEKGFYKKKFFSTT